MKNVKTIPSKEIIETLLEVDSAERIALFFDTKISTLKSWIKKYGLKCKPVNYWVKQRAKAPSKEELQFNCPMCNKERFYYNKDGKHRAKKENTLCYQCRASYVPNFNKPKLNKKIRVLKTPEEMHLIRRNALLKQYNDPNSPWGSGAVKAKTSKSLSERAKNDHEFKKKLLDKVRNGKRKTGTSKLEINFYENIKHLDFLHLREIEDLYQVDILHKKYKLVIEVYGDFWHANPEKYSEDYIVNKKTLKTAKDVWIRDSIRKEKIEKYGYKVLVFWEKDILSKKYDYVEFISNYIKENFENE